MKEIIIAMLALGCGVWIGAIAAAFVILRKSAAEDFDGGFRHETPPARTRIWSDHVETRK